jgi:hypothetical protein
MGSELDPLLDDSIMFARRLKVRLNRPASQRLSSLRPHILVARYALIDLHLSASSYALIDLHISTTLICSHAASRYIYHYIHSKYVSSSQYCDICVLILLLTLLDDSIFLC